MMTPNEKNEIGKLYSTTCKAFDKILDHDVLRMQIEDLCDLNFHDVVSALNQYRRNPKNTQWPRANKIREIVNPNQSVEGMANEAASRIRSAISKFGWPNPTDAKAYIGDLGWLIVERSGGWQYLCENHGIDLNPLTFHAQARDQAKAISESSNAGNFDKPVMIEKAPESILKLAQPKSI